MSSISSSDQGKIQAVDNQLQQYIEQAQAGQQLDPKGVSSLEQQINAMSKNTQIPPGVQQALQLAAKELKQMTSGQGGLNNLYTAKMQLDSVLGNAETGSTVEPASGEKGVGESSLGGGGGGSEEQ
jgi:hypothetical protein